jgi:hypothetical protein
MLDGISMGNYPDSWWADFCPYTRQIEIGPRRGQMQLVFFWTNQVHLGFTENNRIPLGF